jgi:hypothetical protein
MKKTLVGAGLLCAVTLVMAGGHMAPAVSKVSAMESPCVNETVYVDDKTQLMWQDAPYTDAEDGAQVKNRSLGKAGNWRHAVNYCRRLNYAGFTDWRLPTADELTAVHHEAGQHFEHFRDKDFWTSTPTTEGKYYVIYPVDAYRFKRTPRESNYIRCVRCNASEVQ